MKTRTGLWIDHRKAVIVTVTRTGEEVRTVVSQVDKQLRHSGEPQGGRFEYRKVPASDIRERKLAERLNAYYDTVIASIRDAELLFVFGPGEAKAELRRRMEKDHLGGLIVRFETAGRMTDRQVAAKVKLFVPPC